MGFPYEGTRVSQRPQEFHFVWDFFCSAQACIDGLCTINLNSQLKFTVIFLQVIL